MKASVLVLDTRSGCFSPRRISSSVVATELKETVTFDDDFFFFLDRFFNLAPGVCVCVCLGTGIKLVACFSGPAATTLKVDCAVAVD